MEIQPPPPSMSTPTKAPLMLAVAGLTRCKVVCRSLNVSPAGGAGGGLQRGRSGSAARRGFMGFTQPGLKEA